MTNFLYRDWLYPKMSAMNLSLPRKLQRSPRWRKIRASWRDTLLLVREFSWPLFLFILAMIGGGLLYYQLSNLANQPVGSRIEAVYLVLALTF